VTRQNEIALLDPDPVNLDPGRSLVGGCWVCFPRGLTGPGGDQDPAWCATVAMRNGTVAEQRTVPGTAGAAYIPGLMALRLGPLVEQGVRALDERPDVLLLDATAGDHPRRAGLALHLGVELDLPTIGVTHRPLLASGEWPIDQRGATSPLRIGESVVGCWLRPRTGVRPLAIHPGWRVELATAVEIVLALTRRQRTPEPLRRARQLARRARSVDSV
jgi:deoxyribonuclease V